MALVPLRAILLAMAQAMIKTGSGEAVEGHRSFLKKGIDNIVAQLYVGNRLLNEHRILLAAV